MNRTGLTGAEITQDMRGYDIIFIHSSLDDAGLTAQEFRLFGHLMRRAGKGLAFASAETMGKICKLHPDTVWKAIKVLEARRMIVRERRKGQTTIIRITPPTEWVLNLPETEGHPSKPGTRNGGAAPTRNGGAPLPETEGHEGNPQRESKEGNPVPPAPKSRAELERERRDAFTAAWSAAYAAKFGQRYTVTKEDESEAAHLLRTEPPESMIEEAKAAWEKPEQKHFYCFRTTTIRWFSRHLNEVRAELRKAEPAKLPKRTTGGPADF